jgi:hypothetical protein
MMRVRFVVAICASVAALGAIPAAASACPPLGGVKAFTGVAHLGFRAQASGSDEPGEPQYGIETIDLSRSAGLDIKLTHKLVSRLGVVAFTGTASGGTVTVNDTFDDSSDSSAHSAYNYQDPLSNQLPNFGTASLFLDPKKCKYQLTVSFGVRAQSSGEFQGSDSVGGGATSQPKQIPASLNLGRSVELVQDHPDAYYTCPGDPLLSGKSCYQFSGGFATDFMTLFQCHSSQAVNCSSSDGPVGTATFAWHLKPSYKKKK